MKRRGLTLLELIVVLAVLGVSAALVLPSLAPARPPAADLASVVATSRRAAIARAQALELTVAADGRWELRPLAADDVTSVLAGTLDTAQTSALDTSPNSALDISPVRAFTMQLTPLGVCQLTTPFPRALEPWDPVRCVLDAPAPLGGR